MEILLGPPLTVNIFLKTFFAVFYHSGRVELMLGYSLSDFFPAYASSLLVPLLAPSSTRHKLFFSGHSAKVPRSATPVFFPTRSSYGTWGQPAPAP